MGRTPQFPTAIEDLIKLSANVFKGYFMHGMASRCELKINGTPFKVEIATVGDMALFQISRNGNRQQIKMVSRPSNLGKGVIWYFVCPRTKKTCRKLYLYGGYFVHRSAVEANYRNQNEARKFRLLQRLWDFEWGKIAEEMYKPYFKKYYNGRETKRYQRIMAKIEREGNFYDKNKDRVLFEMFNQNKY